MWFPGGKLGARDQLNGAWVLLITEGEAEETKERQGPPGTRPGPDCRRDSVPLRGDESVWLRVGACRPVLLAK